MTARRLRLAGLEFRLTDIVTLGGLVLFTVLAIAFNGRLAHPATLIAIDFLFIALYLASLAVLPRLRRPWPRFLLRTAIVQLTFIQVYKAANELQLIFFPWQDDRVLAWEHALLGSQPLVEIQKFYSVPLNEWMFFVYVFYVIILPRPRGDHLLQARRGGQRGLPLPARPGESCLRTGLHPLSRGQPDVLAERALAPDGTPARRSFRDHRGVGPGQPPPAGGFDPQSPLRCSHGDVVHVPEVHPARRPLARPVMLSLYVSTVYGRFHYLSDMVIGIAAGILVILVAPLIERAWNGRPAPALGDLP